MRDFFDRLQELIDNQSISITELERIIGASKGVLSRSIKNKTDIQCKWLVLIGEKYHQYSMDYLITGEGNLLKTDCNSGIIQKGSTGCHASITTDNSKEENDRCKMCKEKDLQIEDLKERIEGLKERINDQKEHIEELNNRITSLKEQLRGG